MTTEATYPGEDPRRLLSDTRELARRARRAQRATWFPLLVFAAVTFAAIPVSRYGGHPVTTCVTVPGRGAPAQPGLICTAYSNAQFVYWPIALILAYVAIAAFYIRRSQTRGIETRVRPYAIAGIIIAVALTSAALWEAHHPSSPAGLGGLEHRLASPAFAIGLALLVLAWAERNRALALFSLGYLVIVLVAIGTHRAVGPDSFQAYLPTAIHGAVLLIGSIAFALVQRPFRSPAP
jgi:hypothetical protein